MLSKSEDILFTMRKPENVGLDSIRLESGFRELIAIFPNLYSLLIVKDAQLVSNVTTEI